MSNDPLLKALVDVYSVSTEDIEKALELCHRTDTPLLRAVKLVFPEANAAHLFPFALIHVAVPCAHIERAIRFSENREVVPSQRKPWSSAINGMTPREAAVVLMAIERFIMDIARKRTNQDAGKDVLAEADTVSLDEGLGTTDSS
jgi:hypothetical protein